MLRDLSPMARSPVAFSRPSWTSSITRWPLARCSLLALCLACSDDGPKPPALQGAPGVISARYAGPQPAKSLLTQDERNNDQLLSAMERIADRRA